MIVALPLVLLAAWLTWVLFRDDDAVEKIESASAQERNERDRDRRAGE